MLTCPLVCTVWPPPACYRDLRWRCLVSVSRRGSIVLTPPPFGSSPNSPPTRLCAAWLTVLCSGFIQSLTRVLPGRLAGPLVVFFYYWKASFSFFFTSWLLWRSLGVALGALWVSSGLFGVSSCLDCPWSMFGGAVGLWGSMERLGGSLGGIGCSRWALGSPVEAGYVL